MTNSTATAPIDYTATVGRFEVTARVYEVDGRYIIHVLEDGKHTGNTYIVDSAEERDASLDLILGR